MMMKNHIAEPTEEVDVSLDELLSSKLVVYNDDVNTFDHVIHTFMSTLGHSSLQAEQCALMIHTKGKCSVKEGMFDELKPFRDALTDASLDARIE
jgi:ATP-dependent Clp protease adaptor protein ClpS